MRGGLLQRFRLVAATALVTGIVFSTPLADALFFASDDAYEQITSDLGFRAESVFSASGVDEALENLELVAAQGESVVPDWLLDEIGPLSEARDIRVENASQTVGYVLDCDVEEALDALEENMVELGWTSVPLGQVDGFTFVKPSGLCTWALATCTQVGSATSVVITLQ